MGDLGSIPGLGRSPGEGKGYTPQYPGLENSVDCIVHGVAESVMTERVSVSVYHGKEIIFTTIYFCINFKVYIGMFSNKVSISNQQIKEN